MVAIMLRRTLPILIAALALPASASAATFSDPVTLADWSPTAGFPAAADGAAAWTQPDGVHVLGFGRVGPPASGNVKVVAGVAGWAGSDGPHFWAGGGDVVPDGALTQTRSIAVTPNIAAWIGITADGTKVVQIAPRNGTGFGTAQTLYTLGKTTYGLVAAGDADGGALLAWHANDGDDRRIQYAGVARDGHVTRSGWITPKGEDDANPTLALAPDGTGVLAWSHGLPSGSFQARLVNRDGTFGPVQEIDQPGGSSVATSAAGADGTAGVAWRGPAGKVLAAIHRPGSDGFGSTEIVGGENPESVAASVTKAGVAIVAFTDLTVTRAAVAPAGGTFGPPVTLASGPDQKAVAAGGDRVLWDEMTGMNPRLRSAVLQSGGSGGGPGDPDVDTTKPKLKVKLLRRHGRTVRVRVTANESVTARLTARRGKRHTSTSYVALSAGKPRVLRVKAPRGTKKMRLVLRATDASGNTAVVRR
jgi:hypothetical protein